MNELLRARVTRRLVKCLPEFAFGTILHSLYESLREDAVGGRGAGLGLLVSSGLSRHGQSSDHIAVSGSQWQPRRHLCTCGHFLSLPAEADLGLLSL